MLNDRDDVYTYVVSLPTSINAYTIAMTDGTYCIVLNAKMDRETLCRAYAHELRHIFAGDFDKFLDSDCIESKAHAKDNE